jgi:GT2 family glycosyltransferase
MPKVLVITPVKNSVETTLECARAIANSDFPLKHIIFNDFSSEETKQILEKEKEKIGYELIHLEDITDTPSPNYKLVLQKAQRDAVECNVPLVVVESDVIIKKDTIKEMIWFMNKNYNSGLIGAITVGEDGNVNFPYLKFKSVKEPYFKTNRSLSFCCTAFSSSFLKKYDFMELDDTKDWYDTYMSKKSVELGFDNFILMNTPVLHKPHGSRPWKLLKYSNPFKYYFLKFWKGRDKI